MGVASREDSNGWPGSLQSIRSSSRRLCPPRILLSDSPAKRIGLSIPSDYLRICVVQ